jgi:hypothetical protein
MCDSHRECLRALERVSGATVNVLDWLTLDVAVLLHAGM